MDPQAAATADLTALMADLDYASKNAEQQVVNGMMPIANDIATDMKSRAPKRTGRLAASITVLVNGTTITIGPQGVFYAPFQEFGTGIRGEFPTSTYIIKPRMPDGTLVFQINNDQWVFTKEVVHPGIHPHPYARPALQAYLDKLGDKAAEVGVQMLEGKR